MLYSISCVVYFFYDFIFLSFFFFFSSRRRHTRCLSDWSSDVCSSDLGLSRLDGAHLAPPRESSCAIAHSDWLWSGGSTSSRCARAIRAQRLPASSSR